MKLCDPPHLARLHHLLIDVVSGRIVSHNTDMEMLIRLLVARKEWNTEEQLVIYSPENNLLNTKEINLPSYE